MLPPLGHTMKRRQIERLAARQRTGELKLKRLGTLGEVLEGLRQLLHSRLPLTVEPLQVGGRQLVTRAELPQRGERVCVKDTQVVAQHNLEIPGESPLERHERIGRGNECE